jgi:type II secretory pathway component PulF
MNVLRKVVWWVVAVAVLLFFTGKIILPIFANVFGGFGVEIPVPTEWVVNPVKRWTLIVTILTAFALTIAALVMKARKARAAKQ